MAEVNRRKGLRRRPWVLAHPWFDPWREGPFVMCPWCRGGALSAYADCRLCGWAFDGEDFAKRTMAA